MTPWQLELMGDMRASRRGSRAMRFQSRKAGAMMAYLSYYADEDHDRDLLVEKMWWDAEDPYRGRRCLSQALVTLKQLFEPKEEDQGKVFSATWGYIRVSSSAVKVDARELLDEIAEGAATTDRATRIAHYMRASQLYKGAFLPELFEDWALIARERIAKSTREALHQLIWDLEAEGETEKALEQAKKMLNIAPDLEECHYEVMRLLSELGQHQRALRQYDKLTRLLLRDLGIGPAHRTRGLASQIRARLREKSRAAVVRTTAPAEEAPAGAVPAAPLKPSPHIPALTDEMFGRSAEMEKLVALLIPGEAAGRRRLVTLFGAGGTGKSRLAIEAAWQLVPRYSGAVYYVPLAQQTDEEDVCTAILEALRLDRDAEQPIEEQVATAVSGRPTLLVLDNFEQLSAGCGRLVASILERVPDLTCLVTSRQALGLGAETIFTVDPLKVPPRPGTPERLIEFSAVQLFVARAQAVHPDFELTSKNGEGVTTLVQLLEGLPLAIELAAARAAVLTPRQMTAQLAHRFEFLVNSRKGFDTQQRTLREAIDWGYDLLPADLRELFARLSVFRGGWTLEAAQAVWPAGNVLDALDQLQQRSLILCSEYDDAMRYRMLETIREYAEQRLTGENRVAALEGHLRYVSELAQMADTKLQSAESQAMLRVLDPEAQNISAAIDYAKGREEALLITASLRRYFLMRQSGSVCHGLLRQALADNEKAPATLRIRALNGTAIFAQQLGRCEEADSAFREALGLSREAGDAAGRAETLNNMGILAGDLGEYLEARRCLEESIEIRRKLGDEWGIAGSLNNLARLAQQRGESDEALRLYDETILAYRKLGDDAMAALALQNKASGHCEAGEYIEARGEFEQSIMLIRQSGNTTWLSSALYNFGETLARLGELEPALQLIAESLQVRSEIDDRAGTTHCLSGLANLATLSGDFPRAARLFGASAAAREICGIKPGVKTLERFDRDVSHLRSAMGDRDFAVEWAIGSSMPLEAAVAYALRMERTGSHAEAVVSAVGALDPVGA